VASALLAAACSGGHRSGSPLSGGIGLIGARVTELSGSWESRPSRPQNLSAVASVANGQLLLHTAGGDRSFLPGVNIGGAVPGRSPGEIGQLTAEQYRKWFDMAGAIGVRVLRNYTIHPPAFYDELAAYNRAHPQAPLYLFQGAYLVDEQAFIASGNLWQPDVHDAFLAEVTDAQAAVSGHLVRNSAPGRATGRWTTDVTPWLAGWLLGVEIDPMAGAASDERNRDRPLVAGAYFRNTPDATPTERWMAEMMDHLAMLEAAAGRTAPIAFVNWPTDDPLRHPDEPLDTEDLLQIDANHVLPTLAWPGGSFASYHAYPYYPDFQRYEPGLQVPGPDGRPDPYRSYVRALADHHRAAGLPTVISEFGMPSSVGSAHFGPLGRDQGAHSEAQAMRIDADLLRMFQQEGLAGGLVFALFDEWFKFTWNTVDWQIPADRRPLWHDVLTNEQHFGLLAVDSGLADRLRLGDTYGAWQKDSRVVAESRKGLRELRLATDEAYVYLRLRFDAVPDRFTLGFDVLPGANSGGLPGQPGVSPGSDVVVEVSGKGTAGKELGWAGADPTTLFYGAARQYTPVKPADLEDGSGAWVPRRQIVNRPLRMPTTGQRLQAEFVDVSNLIRGTTVPGSKAFDARAQLWATKTDVALRLPWALLGLADPSSKQALKVHEDGSISAVPIDQIGLTYAGGGTTTETAVRWEAWQSVRWTERPKDGLGAFSAAVGDVMVKK
jgi:hypothetical protein